MGENKGSSVGQERLCSHCNRALAPDWILCPKCGLHLKCPSCKRELEFDWTRCPFCAHPIDQPATVLPETIPDTTDLSLLEDARQELEATHVPFYERWTTGRSVPYWVIWVVVGQLLFLLHYVFGLIVGVDVLDDTSWMLGVMIGVGMVLVVSASQNLRRPFVDLFAIMEMDVDRYSDFYREHMRFSLRDRNLVLSGFVLGTVNMGLGFGYGVWYQSPFLVVSLAVQHFLIGFVCGMGVWGGIGIIRLFKSAGRSELHLDFEVEDGCFGTAFLGRKVLKDALYYFGLGVLIATYVLISPWTRANESVCKFLIYAWAAFPYIVALSAFLLPVLDIHTGMEREKAENLDEIRNRRRALRTEIAALKNEKDASLLQRRGRLSEDYDRMLELRSRIGAVTTWPYNFRQILELMTTLIVPILVVLLDLLRS
jgi:hypothetical protein